MNTTMIGSADGPTSIFLAGKMGMGWINIHGLLIIILLLLPNIIYACYFKNVENKCESRVINLMEQIGRFGSMFLMVFNIGIAEFGFASAVSFFVYLAANAVLMLAYWLFWMLYFNKQNYFYSMMLAILPSGMFLLSGILLRHILLVLTGAIFTFAHIYVTVQNARDERNERITK